MCRELCPSQLSADPSWRVGWGVVVDRKSMFQYGLRGNNVGERTLSLSVSLSQYLSRYLSQYLSPSVSLSFSLWKFLSYMTTQSTSSCVFRLL